MNREESLLKGGHLLRRQKVRRTDIGGEEKTELNLSLRGCHNSDARR